MRDISPHSSDARPGTYVVVLESRRRGIVPIGRLGDLELAAGGYLYVGSALGPGGVAARCRHHERIAARPHWHLDYLRPHCRILGFWIAHGRTRREHAWARALGALPQAHWPLARFGASDCDCPAHLIWLPEPPTSARLTATLGEGRWR
ncbi:hypothetical protein Thimo_1502 [Thioflavicoccus mobilis 8321]|uniref:GIY-YIG nuclease family protein n=1 Tax=Thioflavicoccus mobilis 8321 TaxID=765912 RepID=L0GU39_9GAMM|nr:GIY-YIG nuclease family protein [Thioflavicoccus mobilis]AGA90288.1 hypothetical protein Thimo_1502 [Thioflavicoccus mobilis 8321]